MSCDGGYGQFMFYRLHVISFDGGYDHIHALYESTFAVTFDGCDTLGVKIVKH
jgi:hypothetical protein